MTALQEIVKKAKALKKAYPKKFSKWTEYVKLASTMYKKDSKKIAGPKDSKVLKSELAKKGLKLPHGYETIKRKRKIAGVAKKTAKKVYSTHKDTKSHNVNIRVISGISKAGELKRLTELAKNGSKLQKKVAAMLKSKVNESGYDTLSSLLKDILYNGLQSGIISDLIYYSDTLSFYKNNKPEILRLLRQTMNETGYNNPADIFGKNWDKEDPLATDTQNQNLLAWFGFEEITRDLANKLGYEI